MEMAMVRRRVTERDDNGKNKGRSICPNNNPMAYVENNCSTSCLDRVTCVTSTAAAGTSLSPTLGFFSTFFTYFAFLSGTASINKNVYNLHKKSDIYNAKAELRDAEAKLRDAEAKLRDAEAKLDRAKAELRDAKAELRDAEAKLDRARTEDQIEEANSSITSAKQGVVRAKKSLDGLLKAFDRGVDVDSEDAANVISSEKKLLRDIDTLRRKLVDQGDYTPPNEVV
jgi:septal ring factor EnvC (AmiA/AmiB activator)